MDILSYTEQPDSFLTILNDSSFAVPSAVQFRLQSAYNTAYFGQGFIDFSFALCHGTQIKAVIPCHAINGVLCMNGVGIKPYYSAQEKNTFRMIFDHLESLANTHGLSILIEDNESAHRLSAWGNEAYKRGALPTSVLKAEIDLHQEDKAIHGGIRDSYRSLIRQGREEMVTTVMTHENADPAIFEQFRQFHIRVAGRETRSVESWNVQFKMVRAGCAELLMAHMGGHGLVSASFFTDYGPITNYAVAVYNRELFDKPLAHTLIYDGIFRAKGRGQAEFFLGMLPPKGSVSDKEFSISKFKKGFCDRPRHNIEWTMARGAAQN